MVLVKPLTRELKALYSKGRRKALQLSRNPNKQELLAYGVVGASVTVLVGGILYRSIKKLSWGKRPPSKPLGMPYPSNAERDRRYGPLSYVHDPLPGDPEHIQLLSRPNVEKFLIPELAAIGATSGVTMHPDAGRALQKVIRDLKRDGKLHLLKTYSGGYNPRMVRGSTTSLSSHSYGTAIDINAPQNPLGTPGTPEQWELAEYFVPHGFYWGGWFSRQDPHHFDWVGKPTSSPTV